MTKIKAVSIIAAGLVMACPAIVLSQNAPANNAPRLSETRSTLKQWVDLKKLISEEENRWKVEKETLTETIKVVDAEIAKLKEQIAAKEEQASAADVERQKLTENANSLREASAVVKSAIPELEDSIRDLAKYFPQSLAAKLKPLMDRMPKKEADAESIGVSSRMQVVLGILQEIEKFNNQITLEETMQEINGANVAVKALYVGLAVGYYVDGTGSEAGIFRPTENGWVKEPRADLARAIATAVAVYEKEILGEFVTLPVNIN